MRTGKRLLAILAGAILLMPGCGGNQEDSESPAAGGWQALEQPRMTAAQRAQRDRALSARDALFKRLKGRLVEVIGAEGPEKAISVCKSEAPEIARDVAEKQDVAIGRTSFRLRNSKNEPPDWAWPFVEERTDHNVYLASEGRLAALIPIRLGAECVTCHGPPESIPQEVKEALAEQYPEDQATGFEVDALRGWFWVEVPAGEESQAPPRN